MENCEKLLNEYLEAQANVRRPKKLLSSHIEDENQSVKWNREFIENYNTEQERIFREQLDNQSKAWNAYYKSQKDYIVKELQCSEDCVNELIEFVSDHLDGEGLHYELEHLEELVDIIKNIKFEKRED